MFKLFLILPFFVSLTAIAAPVGPDGLVCTNLDISALAFGNPDEPDATLNPCSFFTNPFPCTTDPDRATQLNLSLCPPGTPINVNPGTVGTVGDVAVTAAPGSTACTPFTPDTASIAALGDADLPQCATVATPFQCTNDQGRAAHLFLTPSALSPPFTAVPTWNSVKCLVLSEFPPPQEVWTMGLHQPKLLLENIGITVVFQWIATCKI
ncbi:hypothetical protein B0H13DRAFT_1878872 [Mycena leptocephala]|nr:hypothetical protein B0H13DRAFT_1878872 [Mycena leptocephala]